ncbi:hypothetical protein [Nonomuraea typhae]|uniref:hypothetical protein n=1 Tax=Nonomuraea typhae TaxID=2603600 RepID=UPI0012F7131C|nr:hypothetical protein [Nonomuraea typhae]
MTEPAELANCRKRAIARAARAAREGGEYTLGDIVGILRITKESAHALMRQGRAPCPRRHFDHKCQRSDLSRYFRSPTGGEISTV